MVTMCRRNGAGDAPADPFAHSRRRIEDDEVTLDMIAGSLLRIFVRMEKLDTSLGHLSRRVTDLRKSEQGMSHALFDHRVNSTRGQLLTGSYITGDTFTSLRVNRRQRISLLLRLRPTLEGPSFHQRLTIDAALLLVQAHPFLGLTLGRNPAIRENSHDTTRWITHCSNRAGGSH